MEYIDGKSLEEFIQGQNGFGLGAPVTADILCQIAQGLAAAQAKLPQLAHRDLKPANILLRTVEGRRLQPVVCDFGFAICLDWTRLSELGSTCGTPHYASPEQVSRSLTVGPKSDIFSLGVIAHRLLTGSFPFGIEKWMTPKQAECRIINGEFTDELLRSRMVPCDHPGHLGRLVGTMLAKDPEQRPDANEVIAALDVLSSRTQVDLPLQPPPRAGCNLRIVVSRQAGPGEWRHLRVDIPPLSGTRDMRKNPRLPDGGQVRTGDWVRVEVTADRSGYVVVYNVGPSGNLSVLYPDHSTRLNVPDVKPGRPLQVTEVQLDPPAGTERLIAVWSAMPLALSADDLRRLADDEVDERPSKINSRDMRRKVAAEGPESPTDRIVARFNLQHNAS